MSRNDASDRIPEIQVQKWYENVNTSSSFEQWMTDLPECLKSVPITHLAIPGTHDSMSCGISRTSGISPDASVVVKALGRVFGPLVKPVVYKWSVTQHSSAEEQLTAGVRYFDLRVAVHKPTKTFQFVHGMYAQEISQAFIDIKQFLANHKHEVVVLDFQHFYNFSASNHLQLQNILNYYFSEMLCPLPANLDTSLITLKLLNEQDHQIIVIYRDQMAHGKGKLWPSQYWPTPWPQTTSVPRLLSFLEKGLSQRPSNAGYVTQGVLTPTSWFVVKHPLSNLLERCAAPCNRAMISWLEQQKPGKTGVNVVISDYYDFDAVHFPFIKTVVLLNRKLVCS